MLVQPNQIKAARALLNWTIADLAEKVGVGTTTISAIETGRSAGSLEVITSIIYAFQNAGIELTNDGGVRPSESKIAIYRGKEGFCAFFDDVYEVAKNHENPNISITNVEEQLFDEWLGSYEPVHANRMTKLIDSGLSRIRAILKENDTHLTSTTYCEYRWLPEEQNAKVSLYIYGNKVAFTEFSNRNVTVTVIDNTAVTEAHRKMFEIMWNSASERPIKNEYNSI